MTVLIRAEVAELADALVSGTSARKGVRVQVPSSALKRLLLTKESFWFGGKAYAYTLTQPEHT